MTNALSNWRLSLKSDGIPLIFDKLWVCKVFACSCHGFFVQVKKINAWVMKGGERGTDRHKNWKTEREKRHTHTHSLNE